MTINKKTGIAIITGLILITLVSLALAFPGNSSTYSFLSSTQGVAGGEGTSSTYSLRSTQTANQPGNGNATSSTYSMNLGWFNLTYAAGVVTLTLNSVQCSNDTSNYYSCSQMPYNANVTHIRVNCSAQNSNVTTVSYKLYNTPDSTYYINESNYTYASGDMYILNSSYKLQDSGEWNLTVTCYNNASNTSVNSTNWTLPWGWVNVSLVSPSTDSNVTKDQFFTFQSRVSCTGGECGTLNMTLDPFEAGDENETGGDAPDTGANDTGRSNDPTDQQQDAQQTVNNINILLEYKGGSQWDEDNDGTESTSGAVDLTVEDTGFDWEVDESNLCTKWMTRSMDNATDTVVCYGSEKCCNLMDLNPIEESWDSIFYSHYGRYGATYDNLIAAQVVYADYSFQPENMYSEVYYSDWDDLPVIYEETNDTMEDVAQVFSEGEKISSGGKEVGEKIEDEPDYETHFVRVEETDDTLILIFYHDADSAMRVRIEGDVERTMTTRYAEPFQEITLTVYKEDGILPRFELHLGEESEVFRFGKTIPTISIEGGRSSVIDRADAKLDAEIVKGIERIDISGLHDESEINADITDVPDPIIKTNAAYIENLTNIDSATITLQADQTITGIFYCPDFNLPDSSCASWQKTDTPFTQEEGYIRFTVDHFSAYAGGTTNETSYLVVWDETDPGMPNASQSKALNASVMFFADYKTTNNGTKITDGTCQIKFGSGNYTDMTYNSTYTYYTYNRSFSSNGVYSFNVKCNHSSYSTLNATDRISIPTTSKNGAVSTTEGATPFYTNDSNPQACSTALRGGDTCTKTWNVNATGTLDTSHVFFVIANMTSNRAYIGDNVSSNITLTITANDSTAPAIAETNVSPLIANTGDSITIYATATDNVQVDTCWANITLPNSTVVQKTDVCTSAKTYTTAVAGTHNVTFYANDTSGNTATPSSVTFTVDTSAPNLNSTSSSVTSSSATISYTANESSNASVSYGTSSTNLSNTATSTSFTASGSVSLSSLSASTLYYYNITICDQAGNCATNGTYNLTTSAASSGGGGGGGGSSSTTTCSPEWVCSSWSGCMQSGEKTRTCTDANNCGDETDKPSETANCVYVLPVGSVERGGQKEQEPAAEEPSEKPSEAETTRPVKAPPAQSEEKKQAPEQAPITGQAVKEEHKAQKVTLETGWWLLVLLVLIVIAVTMAIEHRRHRRMNP